jgi:NAD(P)-dependent dehydrogenase (short-subunit alcohol dehydrogenase family)
VDKRESRGYECAPEDTHVLLADRVAIVSGIGPGMGRDISLAFAREGAHVVLGARTAAALEEVAAEVAALGRRALPVPTDIAQPEDCRRLAAAAHEAFGRVDVLVNNAYRGGPYEPVEHASMEAWRRIFDVNLFGAIELSKAVVPYMKAQGGGSIIMINSMSIRVIEPRFGGYAASKGALMAAAQTMARELGSHGIRVNSVVPGYIWGKSLEGYFRELARQQGTTPEAVYREIASRTSLNHIPTSAEIAGAVVFFASDLSRVVTGQALDVNAGHFFH